MLRAWITLQRSFGLRGGGSRLSDCGRSARPVELTLTDTKPTFIEAACDAVNVGEAVCSSHQHCHVGGSH